MPVKYTYKAESQGYFSAAIIPLFYNPKQSRTSICHNFRVHYLKSLQDQK